MRVIGVRGSGETATQHDGFGRTVKKVVRRIEHANSDARSKALGYPAIPVDIWDPDYYTGEYTDSVRRGVGKLTAYIKHYVATRCGRTTPILLVGYSQGAQVVGDAYQGIEVPSPETPLTAAQKSHIVGVALIADPKFRGSQRGRVNVGTYRRRINGIQDITTTPRRLSASAPVRAYCMGEDVVCQASVRNLAEFPTECVVLGDCPHSRYMTETYPRSGMTYTDMAAHYLLARWRAAATGSPRGIGPLSAG